MADGTTLSPSQTGADDDGGAPQCPLPGRQVDALGDLIDIGLKIARAIERQVGAADEPRPVADLNAAAMAYSRVARAVRQTILLQSKLTEALDARRKAAAARAGVKARMARILRQAIEAEHDGAEQVERLTAEAVERLELEDLDDALVRPVRDIIAGICHDLSLHPDWLGLDDEIRAVEDIARRLLGDAASGAPPPEPDGPIEVIWLPPEPAPIRPAAADSS